MRIFPRSSVLGLVTVLTLSGAFGCGLFKKKDKEEDKSSTTTTTGDNKGSTTTDNATPTDDDPPAGKPYKGCKMPNGNVTADWTITKGCKTKVKARP
jgi:hypothetical protein